MTILRLKPETLRECALVRKRSGEGLTPDEERELRALQIAAQRAADEAAEQRTEGRLLPPFRANPHEP